MSNILARLPNMLNLGLCLLHSTQDNHMIEIDWNKIQNIEHFLNKDEKVAIERSKRYREDVSFLINIIRSFKEEDWKVETKQELSEYEKRKIHAIDDIVKMLVK